MEARAALYAGSIAKYGATTPLVTLPGGEVGITNAKGNAYYTIALKAAQEIINGSDGYALYKSKPDLADNFANIFFAKDMHTLHVQSSSVSSSLSRDDFS